MITMQVPLLVILTLRLASAGRIAQIAMEMLEPIPLGEEGSKCRQDNDLISPALYNSEIWALNMMDASSKIPTGLLTGNILDLGNYDQCIGVEGPGFKGQHCIVQLETYFLPNASNGLKKYLDDIARTTGTDNVHLLMTYEFSMCVPSTCNVSQVEEGVRNSIDPDDFALLDLEPSISVNPFLCSTSGSKPLLASDYVFIGSLVDNMCVACCIQEGTLYYCNDDCTSNKCFITESTSLNVQLTSLTVNASTLSLNFRSLIVFILLLLTVGTLYDLHSKNKENTKSDFSKVLLAFSLKQNWEFLISTKVSPDRLSCLDGIRFLSLCWIVWAHWYLVFGRFAIINITYMVEWRLQWYRIPLINGTLSTDTFLLLSGLLVSIKFLELCDKIQCLPNIFQMYFLRYVRLTPLYAVIIFFLSTLIRFVGSGPRWNYAMYLVSENCTNNWWVNLLYVNNYVNLDHRCMGESWYLDVDFQLFLVSPLLLFPIWKLRRKPRLAYACLGLAIFLCTLPPLLITAINKYPGTIIVTTELDKLVSLGENVFIPAYMRAGPFVVGITLGFILRYTHDKKFHKRKLFACFLWVSSPALFLAAMFGAHPLFLHAPEIRPVESMIYAGFNRTTWALGVAILIFTCCKGMANPINNLLSMRFFQPLSKLTYSIYLIHLTYMICEGGAQRTTEILTDYVILQKTTSTMVQCIVVGAILCITVELPFRALLLVWVNSKARKIKSKQSVGVNGTSKSLPESEENTEKEVNV